ncbi:MAG: ABC transporter substrate-binding protein [Rhizobiales bacterium]|nr:ABC transporter substrate-binding protein [Hyphomicrobiales bacterium]
MAIAALAAGLTAGVTFAAQAQSVELWSSRDAQQGSLPIIAKQQGFFQENGVDVTLKFVSSGSELSGGMAGGTIPIAVAASTNPMAMAASGIPVKILAQISDISGIMQVLVRDGSGITKPSDLEGKKIGITRIPLSVSVLERGCAVYGCDLSKIEMVNMQPEDIVLGYERGNVDAVLTWEPWASYVVQRGGKVMFSATKSFIPGEPGEKKIDAVYAALFARPDFIDAQPKAVDGILRALSKAAEFLKSSPDEAAEMVGKVINIPPDVVKSTYAKINTGVVLPSQFSVDFDAKSEYLLKLGELRGAVKAAEVIDPAPLKAVCPECVTLP